MVVLVADDMQPGAPRRPTAGAGQPGESPARATVMIVDDSMTVRMDLAEAFEAAGFRARPCGTVAEARQALAEESPDVAVLDVVLPDGDGVTLLQEIRASASGASTAVLMLSTEAEIRDRIRGMQVGADEYVGKPYDAAHMVARTREILRSRGRAISGKVTVLVIDDSPTFREELRAGFEGIGLHVVTAASGEEGLRAAAGHGPSAIVVDGVLPGIDGPTVIRRIRLDAALQHTPCLLLTASEDQGAEVRALDAGADAFVRKDEDVSVILARLSALLRQAGSDGSRASTASFLGPKRILAVDDSPTYLNQLEEILRTEGYDVVPARSGEEALELLGVQTVDCILLDLQMPGLSGRETCRRIKAAPVIRDVPVIMLTSVDDRDAMIEGLQAGADDYISKASEFGLLKARVAAQIRRKQFEDESRRVREALLCREMEALRESDNRFRQIADSLPQLVWTTSADGSCEFLSQQWSEFTGAAANENLGAEWLERVHPDDRPALASAWSDAIAAGVPFRLELRIRRYDGAYRWFDARAVPLRDGAGRIVKWFGSNTDIHEQREMREALRESEDRFKTIFRLNPIGNLLIRLPDQIICEVNDACVSTLGYERSELVGRRLDDLGVVPDRRTLRALKRSFLKTGRLENVEMHFLRKGGALGYASVSAELLATATGRYASTVFDDITVRKRAEEAVRQTTADLQQFAYAAAHDLQEPLRNVATSLGLLKRLHGDRLEQDGSELVRESIDSAQRLHGMVKDLLAFTRIVDGGGDSVAPIDANAVVRQVLENLQTTIGETGATVACRSLPVVRIREVHLVQLFQNLISNSIKYRAEGRPCRVEVSATRGPGEWRFTVADNGIGFEPAYAERIFRVFQRLHQRHEYSGSGIGLALCARIVASYAGRIWAEGQPGIGARFHFTLPADA